MDRLYDKLISYTGQDFYPMHMPGHKRNTKLMQMVNPYGIDITEIEGFDNLHQAEGILKHLSERLSSLYGAGESFPLINGSTAGILAGISAATSLGDSVLFARNVHKSVYHAAILRGLKPTYIYPPQISQIPINGGIYSKKVEELLIKNQNIKLVVITSPTYEGVVSDIQSIAKVVHSYGAYLLVDEAHGAHFGFHQGFPKSAVSQGADLVIQSLHKTLPAFTQTAVLHSNCPLLNRKLQQNLAIYQSSSPSYLLMAGMDRCISMLEDQGKALFDSYDRRLQSFYQSMKALKYLSMADDRLIEQAGIYDFDPSKITISVKDTDLSGHQLQELLRKDYHIEMEMAAPEYVLGMTSIGDTEEGFHRLAEALLAIDRKLGSRELRQSEKTEKEPIKDLLRPLQALLPQEAVEQKSEQVRLRDSAGRISATFISLFPPGSPILVPGERIDIELLEYLNWVKQEKITITGLIGDQADEIEVVAVT